MDVKERATKDEQRAAHNAVYRALRRGELVKPTACSWCGAEGRRIHGHHPDYNRPLMVVWICDRCHGTHTKRYDLEFHVFDHVRC